jgi:hypothetical protein
MRRCDGGADRRNRSSSEWSTNLAGGACVAHAQSAPFGQCFFLRKRPKNAVPGGLSRALANARLNVRQERRESAPVVLIALAWRPDRTRRAIRGADVGLQRRPTPR